MFNKENEIVDAVSPMDGEEVDLSGKIYHSGDERHGVSINDDEMISVELKDLPEYIHHIVFFSTIQSGHDFATVVNPEARVFDGMSNKNLLLEKIDGEDLAGKTAHIFCRIYRGEEDWMIHNISELRVDAEIKDWVKEVKPFLK
jgi:stress response protein SCP2